MIRAIVLDAGGVLVHPAHRSWNTPVGYADFLGEYAPLVDTAPWLAALEKYKVILREDVYVRDLREEGELRREFLRCVLRELDWHISPAAFDGLCRDFTWNKERYVWYADCVPGLRRLRQRLPLGILSDAMPSFRRVLMEHPCAAFVDAAVISAELGFTKPAPEMYRAIAARLGVAPDECLFTDDLERNLRGAMACGMQAVQMDREGVARWDGPVARDLAGLEEFL